MFRLTLCVLSLTVLARGLRADDKPPVPKVPPLFQGTAKVEGDNLRCLATTVRHRPEQRTRTVIKGGQPVTETVTVTVALYVTEERLVPLKDVRAYVTGAKGADPTKLLQSLDPTKLAGTLKKDTPVYFAADAEKVGPEWVKRIKRGSVILVLPAAKPKPKPPAPTKKE